MHRTGQWLTNEKETPLKEEAKNCLEDAKEKAGDNKLEKVSIIDSESRFMKNKEELVAISY